MTVDSRRSHLSKHEVNSPTAVPVTVMTADSLGSSRPAPTVSPLEQTTASREMTAPASSPFRSTTVGRPGASRPASLVSPSSEQTSHGTTPVLDHCGAGALVSAAGQFSGFGPVSLSATLPSPSSTPAAFGHHVLSTPTPVTPRPLPQPPPLPHPEMPHPTRPGIWESDSSQRLAKLAPTVTGLNQGDASVLLTAPENRPTLRVAYFFSGQQRKASLANSLKRLCAASGFGLRFEEIDIMIGGSEHDLLDKESQENFLNRIADGEFDFIMYSPPCGTWSRANWANGDGPKPCRDFKHPWGLPNQRPAQRRRAHTGNEFIHFVIRAIAAQLQAENRLKCIVRGLLEHPEDLGAVRTGRPASIWQLPEIRRSFPPRTSTTVAGHQCQFAGVDRKKPTRLFGNLPNLASFGRKGWPQTNFWGKYLGPLPFDCGHNHRQRMVGRNKEGGFNTSPTAAYPAGMCEWTPRLCSTTGALERPFRRGGLSNFHGVRRFPHLPARPRPRRALPHPARSPSSVRKRLRILPRTRSQRRATPTAATDHWPRVLPRDAGRASPGDPIGPTSKPLTRRSSLTAGPDQRKAPAGGAPGPR